MLRKTKPKPLVNKDGPFRFIYIAVMAVPGMRLQDSNSKETKVWSFASLNSKAFLTNNWDAYCDHMDRSNALGVLLLTAFQGKRRFARLSAYWYRLKVALLGQEKVFFSNFLKEAKTTKATRHQKHTSTGCYLIYKADGELLEPLRLNAARKCGGIGFGFDILRGETYRDLHRSALHCSATAVSLAVAETNGSPETHFVGDIIYLTGKDGLVIYPRTIKVGSPTIVISSPIEKSTIEKANSYIPAMIGDRRIETAISLSVQSQKQKNDNLRSFIAAWSSLELIINRFSKSVWGDWKSLLGESSLPNWDKNLYEVPAKDYRLRDRFFSVACVLDADSAESDCQKFVTANTMRSGFYHRLEVQEKDLPTSDVRELFRKYLKLGLSYRVE